VQISMDGKGRVFDNIFIERLWQTVKVEELYTRDYQTVAEARYYLGRYFEFYNNERLHGALGYRTPAEVYGVAVGTPVALRAPYVPTALTKGDESTLKQPFFVLTMGRVIVIRTNCLAKSEFFSRFSRERSHSQQSFPRLSSFSNRLSFLCPCQPFYNILIILKRDINCLSF